MHEVMKNPPAPGSDYLVLMFVAFFLPKILFGAGIILITLTLYGGLFQ